MFSATLHRQPSFRQRVLAGLLALTVLALGLVAVAPSLHDALHHDDHGHATDHYCAVDMFAAGVALTAVVAFFAPVALLALGSITPVTRITLPLPSWSRPPGRGLPTA